MASALDDCSSFEEPINVRCMSNRCCIIGPAGNAFDEIESFRAVCAPREYQLPFDAFVKYLSVRGISRLSSTVYLKKLYLGLVTSRWD